MSDKVKPWQNRKPRHHGSKGGKRPHQRPATEKFFTPIRDSHYGQGETEEEWDEERAHEDYMDD